MASRPRSLRIAFLMAAAAVGLAPSARSGTLTWYSDPDGLAPGGSGTWDLIGLNWQEADLGGTPTTWLDDGSGDARFEGDLGDVTLASDIKASSLTFAVDGYRILGGAGPFVITLGAGGITADGDAEIASGLTLGASQTWSVLAAKNLTVSGAIGGTGGIAKQGAGTLTLTSANTFTGATTLGAGTLVLANSAALAGSTLDLSGGTGSLSFATTGSYQLGGISGSRNLDLGANTLVIGGNNASTAYSGILSGTGNLTKTGTGTLTLSGANTFTGKVAVNGGILSVAADSALGATPAALVADAVTLNGGTLAVTAGNISLTANRGITLGAGGGVIDTSSIADTTGLPVTLFGPIAGSGNLTIRAHGDISATGGGSGTRVFLRGANTFTGTVTISDGLVDHVSSFGDAANTLRFANGGGLAAASADAITRSIEVQSTGGTLRLLGAISVTHSGALSGSGTLNRTDNGTLTLAGDLSGFTGTYANLAGTTVIDTARSWTSAGVTLTAGSLLVRNNHSALGSAAVTVDGSVTFGTQTSSATVVTANNFNVSGTNTLSLSSSSAPLVMTGALAAGTGNLYLNAGNITLAGAGATGSVLTVAGTGGAFIAPGFSGTFGTVRLTSVNSNQTAITMMTGGTLQATGSASDNRDAYFHLAQLGGTARLAQLNSNQSEAGNGGGFAGLSSYDLLGGVLEVGHMFAGSGGGSFNRSHYVVLGGGTLRGTVADAAWQGYLHALPGTTSQLDSNGFTLVPIRNISGTGTINLTGTSGLLRLNNIASATTSFSGAGALEKAGTGTTALSGDFSAYSGTLTLAAGTTQLGADVNRGFGGVITGSGALQKVGAGVLTLTGANTWSGNLAINAGAVSIDSVASLPGWDSNGRFTVAAGAALAVGNSITVAEIAALRATTNFTAGSYLGFDTTSGDRTYSANLTGAVGVAKYGANVLTLTGGTTFTGNLLVQAGTLDLGGATRSLSGQVAFGGGLTRNGSIVSSTSAYDGRAGSVSANLGGSVGLTKTTEGVLALSGTNTYTGITTVNAGVLAVAGKSSLPGWNLNRSWFVASGGSLTVGNGFSDADVELMLGLANFGANASFGFDTSSGDRVYAGAIGNSTSGARGLAKSGANTLTVSGISTFTGPVVVAGGTLAFGYLADGGPSNLGAYSSFSLANGGALRFTGTLGSTVRSLAVGSGGGVIQVDAGGTLVFGPSASGVTGAWTGSGGVTKTGAGTLTVGNNYSVSTNRFNVGSDSGGNFTMAEGVLNISPTQYLTFGDNSQDVTFLQTGGTVNYTAPNGSYIGNGSAGPYSASLIITGGTFNQPLEIMRVGQNGYSRGYLTIGGGAGSALANVNQVQLAASGGQATGTVTLLTGGTLATSSITRGAGAGFVVFDGGTLRATAAASNFLGGIATTIRNGGAFLDDGGFAVTVSQSIIGADGSTGGLTKRGSGVLRLASLNAYSGNTTVEAGTLAVASAASLPGWNAAGRLSVSAGAGLAVGNNFTDAQVGQLLAAGGFAAGSLFGFDTFNGDRAFTGVIADTAAGSLGLVKVGANTLTLSGDNTFTGAAAIREGILISSRAAALATASSLTVANGATLAVAVGGAAGYTDAQLGNLLGRSTFADGSTLGFDTSSATAPATYSSALSGGLGFTKLGAGQLTLSGALTYGGPTNVLGGSLVLSGVSINNTSALNLGGGSLDLGGGASRVGAVSLTAAAASGVTLANGSLTASSFAFSNASGNAQLSAGLNSLTGGIAKTGNGTVTLTGGSGVVGGTLSVTGGTFAVDGATLSVGSVSHGSNAVLTLGSGSLVTTVSQASLNAGTVNITGGSHSFIGFRSSDSSGASTVINHTGGVLTVTGAVINNGTDNSFMLNHWGNGAVSTYNLSGGTLNVLNTKALLGWDGTAVFNISGGVANLRGLNFNSARNNSVTVNLTGGRLNLGVSGIEGNNNASEVFNVGAGTIGAYADWSTTQNLVLTDAATGVAFDTTDSVRGLARTITLSGVLSGSGALRVTGSGATVLAAANTYTGLTTVLGGALRLSNATALAGGIGATGGTGALALNGGVIDLAAGDFSRALGTGAGQVAFAGSGGFSATGAARTVNLGGATAQVAWGAGSFVPDGGQLILGHALSNATVTFANPIDLGAAARTVRADEGSAAIDGILSGAITGTGSLVKTGAGTLRLTGTNTYSGGTVVSAGALSVASSASLPGWNQAGGFSIASGAALAVDNTFLDADLTTLLATGNFAVGSLLGFDTTAGNREVTAALTSPVGLVKTGANTLTLSGANNFTGDTLVSGGTLLFSGGSDRVSVTGAINVTGGTLDLGGNSQTTSGTVTLAGGSIVNGSLVANGAISLVSGTLSANVSGSGGLTKSGLGTGVLSGSNTFSGGITVAGGTLQLSGASAAGANTLVVNGGDLALLFDGTLGLGLQDVSFGNSLDIRTNAALSVGRLGSGTGGLNLTALNKTAVLGDLVLGANRLEVVSAQGYGVAFGAANLTGAAEIAVAVATDSNVVSGAEIRGIVSGSAGLTKSGPGTLVLGNAGNTFSGNLTVNAGYVAAGSGGALGSAANEIRFAPGAGFRALDSFSLGRTLRFSAGASSINLQVVSGKTLEFTGALADATNLTQLVKSDRGTLRLSAAGSSSWSGSLNTLYDPTVLTGGLLINAGVVEITHAQALGAASNVVALNATAGAALHLSGGITLANTVAYLPNANFANGMYSGVRGIAALSSVDGANTLSGLLTIRQDFGVGAATGATLNLTGGVQAAGHILSVVGPGTVNVSGGALTVPHSIYHLGSGTLNLTSAIGAYTGNGTRLFGGGGTMRLAGDGVIASNNKAHYVYSGDTLWVDNSGSNFANRLGGAGELLLTDGNFRLTASSSGSTWENFAALTTTWGSNLVQVDTTGQSTVLRFTNIGSNVIAGGSNLIFRAGGTSAAFGTAANTVLFTTTAPNLSNGIMPGVVVVDSQGVNLATHVGGSLRALTAYTDGSNLGVSSAYLTNANVKASSSVSFAGGSSVNALVLDGGVALLPSVGNPTLTLSTGNLLVSSGTATIFSGLIIQGTAGTWDNQIAVAEGAVLNVDGTILNSYNTTIAQGGTVNFNAKQYFNTGGNWLTLGRGRVELLAGDNTLYEGTSFVHGQQNLALGYGAVLDLNGNVQMVGALRNPNNNGYENAGGEITSSTAALFVSRNVSTNGENFGGRITGAVTFLQHSVNTNTRTFYSDNTYTGKTVISGGTFQLYDGGRISGTSAIEVNSAYLNIRNDSMYDLADRVADSAPITLRGGFIYLQGRAQGDSRETLGAVTLASGISDFRVDTGGTGVNSTVLTLASLTSANDGAVNFRGWGLVGSAGRLIIADREVSAGLTNNLIGAWAVVNGGDFASYVPGIGVGALNQTGFAGYDGTVLPAASSPNANIKLAAAATQAAGDFALNSLVLGGNYSFTNATDTLRLTSGGLLRSSAAATFGAAADSGRLTAGAAGASGTQSLHIHANNAAVTMNSRIVDNGSAPVRLVLDVYNGGSLTLLSANNSYTGGTVVNGWTASIGTLTVGATGRLPGGGVTLNNANLSLTAGGVIDTSNVVTLNNTSALTLTGNNTLAGLVFNHLGGTNSSVATGGTLTLTGGITATNPNTAAVGIITGALTWNGAAATVTVNPMAYDGRTITDRGFSLLIDAVISNTGLLTIQGGGNLALRGANTFAGGVLVKSGTGVALNTNTGFGTGNVTFEDNARLLAYTGSLVAANAWSADARLVYEGATGFTLGGAGTLRSNGTTSINVVMPQSILVLTGALGGTNSVLEKTGLGPLRLGNSVNTLAGVKLTEGTLQLNNATALGTAALELAGGNLDSATANLALTTTGAQTWSGDFGFVGSQNLNLGTGAVTLTDNRRVGTSAGVLTVGGVISDGGAWYSLTKLGAGTLALSGVNTYGGNTVVAGGALRLASADALPLNGGNLSLSGGVVDLAFADFSRPLGSGAGQVSFGAPGGGFAATGAARTVNLGGFGAQVAWGSGSFLADGSELILSHSLSDNTITFANPIALGSSARTVRVDNGSAAVDAVLGGALSGTGGLVKAGAGTLRLDGASTYTGATVLAAGTLVAGVAESAGVSGAFGNGGALTFTGGALQISSFLTGDIAARIQNSTGAIAIDTNGLGYNLTGNLAASNTGGFTKLGAGTLRLTGTNAYTGATTVTGGTLVVGSDANLGVSSSAPLVLNGGTVLIAGADRFVTGRPLTLTANSTVNVNNVSGAVFGVTNGAGLTLTKEGVGELALGTGAAASTLRYLLINGGNVSLGDGTLTLNAGGAQSILASASSTISGGTIVLGGASDDMGTASGTVLTINSKFTGGNTFESYAASGATGVMVLGNSANDFTGNVAINIGIVSVASINNAGTASHLGAGSGTNNQIQLAGGTALRYTGGASTTNRVINLTGTTSGGTIDHRGTGLLRFTADFLATGAGNKSLTLTGWGAGSGEINANVVNSTGTTGIIKEGTNTWILSRASSMTYTGATDVRAGTLELNFANLATPTNLVSASSALTLGGGTLYLRGKNGATGNLQTFAGLTLNGTAGSRLLANPNGNTAATGVSVTLGAITATTAGSSLLLGKDPGSTGTVAFTTTTAKGATNIYSSRIVYSTGTGYDWMTTVTGASPFTLSGLLTADYTALLATGTNTANSRLTASSTLTGSVTTNTLKVEGPAASQSLGLGANTLTLTGGGLLNTGTNAFSVTGGTITAGNGNGAYELLVHQYSTGTLTIGSVIANNATNGVALTKAGTGTLDLTGANTYTGATYVHGGTLVISGSAASTVVTLGGGTLRAGSAGALATGATVNVNVGTLDLNGFSRTLANLGAGTLGGLITDNAAGTGVTTLTLSGYTPALLTRVADGATRQVALVVANTNNGSNFLNNENTFSGGLTLANGSGDGTRLSISNSPVNSGVAGAIVSSPFGRGTITIGQAATDKAQFYVNTVNGQTFLNDIVYNTARGTDRVGAFRLDLNNFVLAGTQTSGLAPVNFSTNSATASAFITGKVTGALGLQLVNNTFVPAGVLTLTLANAAGTNDYSGDTLIEGAHALVLGASNQLPDGSGKGNLVFTGTGSFDLNGLRETVNGLSGSGTIDGSVNSGGAAYLGVGSANASSTFAGTIRNTTGALTLDKLGTGTLTLTGAATHTGGTVVTGGVLSIGSGGTAGSLSGNTSIASGAALVFNRSDAVSYAGAVSGAGQLRQLGAGTLTLSGSSTHTGGTLVSSGTVAVAADAALGGVAAVPTANQLILDSGTLSATESFTLAASRGVGLGGESAAGTGTFSVAAGRTLTVAGVVADRGTAAGSLVKAGAGTLVLSGANTHTGSITVQAGRLEVSLDSNLGAVPVAAAANRLVLAGGTLAATNGFVLSANRGIALTGTGTVEVAASQTLSYAGVVADGVGAGSLVKTGAGTLLLSGDNTFTGTTTVSAGTLAVGGAAVFGPSLVTVASGATLAGDGMVSSATLASGGRIAAGVSGVGILTFDTQVTFQGASTVSLGVASNAVSSSVEVAGGLDILGGNGSVTFDFGNRLAEIGAGTHNLLSYGGLDPINLSLFSVNQANKGARQTLTLVDSVGTTQPFAVALQVENARAVWSGLQGASWTAADNWTLDTDGTVTSFLAADAVVFDDDGASGSVNLLQDVNPASIVFSGDILDYELGSTGGFRITSGALSKTGAASLTLLSANSFTGGSTLAAGAVRLGNDAALGTGRVELDGGRLSSVGSAPRTLANAFLIGGNASLGSVADNGLLTLAGAVDLGGATRSLAVDSDVVISGAVGNGGLTKTGAGALTLSGANTFGGGLTLQAGSLRVGSADALGFGQLTLSGGRLSSDSASARVVANTMVIGADVALGDAARTGVLTLSGAIGLAGDVRRLDLASDVVISGSLSDGGLTKAGSGTLTLTGASTYAGGTVVEAGILRIGAGGLTGSLLGDIDNEGSVIFNRSNRLEVAGILSGSGDFSHLGSGTLALSGLNTQTGTFTVAGGVLEVAADANLGAGDLVLDGGELSVTSGFALDAGRALTLGPASGSGSGTLRVAAGQTLSYAGEIGERGVATLVKQGAGTLVLAGDSTHTGGTVIAAGTLRLGDGAAAGSVLGNIANSGTLVFNRSDTLVFGGVISGVGSLVQAGSGSLSLTAENTFTGTTTVSAGTLLVSADSQLGEAPGSATAGSITLSGGVLAANSSFQLASSRGLAVAASGGFLSVGDGATLTYGGTVGNIAGQAGLLVKQGAGTLVLTNLTAHTGGTRVAEGTLRIAGSAYNLLGSPSAPITISAGAVLTAANATNNAHNLGLLTLEGGTLTSVNGPGGVANDGNFGNWILRGVVVGGSAASLISSTTLQVNSGEFTVGDVAAGVDLLVSSRITGTSAVTKAGLGTMELSGANAHTGTTSVNAGTLLVTNASGLGTGALSLGGGTLHLAADTAIGSRNLTLAGSGGTIVLDRATQGEALAVSLANLTFGDTRTLAVTKGANATSGVATLNFTGFPNLGPANKVATIDTGADVLVNITGSLTGTQAFGLLTKSGAGTLALSGNNNYWDPTNGLVTVSAGTLDLRNVNALGDGTNLANSIALSLAGGATVRYATDSAQGNYADVTTTGTGVAIVLDRATAGAGIAQQFDLLNLAAGSLVVRAGEAVTSGTSIANFNATTLSGNATLDVRNSAAGGAGRVNLNGAVSGAGYSLTKAGSGTLNLAGANTYTGGTSVDGGTLILTGTISNTGPVAVNTGTLVMGNNDRFGGHVTAASPAITVGAAGVLQSGGFFNTLVNLSLNGGRVELTGGANANFGAFALKGAVTVGGSQASVITAVSGSNNTVNLGPTDAAGTVAFDISDATGDAAADLLVEAVLRDNRNTASTAWLANGINKTGAGTLALAAANSFSGETRATAGVIRLQDASALGSSTLRLAAGDTGTVDFAVAGDTNYVLGGLAGERDLSLGSNSLTVGGNNGSAEFSGVLSLGGSLTKVGTGTLGLLGANAIGGAVSVNAGLLGFGSGSLDSAASLTLNGGGLRWASGNTQDISGRITFVAGTTATLDTNGNDVTLAGALGGGTNVNLVKAGAGNLALGAALAHTGSLSVTGGSLEFGQGYLAGSSGISLGGGSLRWASGNTEDISSKVSFVAGQTAGFDTNGQDITLATGLGNSTTGGLRKSGAGTLTLSASATFTGNLAIDAGALRLSGAATLAGGSYAGAIANAGQLQVATSANQTLTGAVTGAGSIAKSGSGALTLGGNSSFSGGVEVTDGTLRLSSSTGAGTGTITLGGAGSGNVSLLINNNSDPGNAIVVSALGTGTVTIGTDGGGAGNNPTLFGGNLTLNRATTLSGTSTDRTTYTGVLSGNVGTLTIAGGGRTTLDNNANDYVGATVVAAGSILQVNHAAGVLPDGTDLTLNGTLYLNLLAQETVASLAGSGAVQVHPSVVGAHRLIVAGESSTTFSGIIRNGGGTVSLGKSGGGTLTLTGANTYTAGTSVTGGTLAFAAGSLGSAGQVAVDGGTLRWEGANTSDLSARLALGANGATLDTGANEVTFAGALNAAGNLTKQGSGTLVLLADGAVAGSASVGAGRLVLGSLNSVGGAAIDIAAGATLTLGFSVATDTTLANAITGAGQLEVATSGAGKLSLGAYNGDIRLSGGDLDVTGFAGNISYAGGSVVNGLAAYGGTVTITSGATWMAADGLPANVILVQNATIDFAGATGQALTAAIDYRGGSLANGDGFVGNLMVNGTGVNLVAGSLGNGVVLLANGNSASVGTGLANTIRYQGGALSNLAGFAGRLEVLSGAVFRTDGQVGGTVAVASGATLAGSGTYNDIEMDAGSTLAPGNSPGVITANTFSLQGGTNLQFQFFSEQELLLVDGTLRAGFDRIEATTLNLGDASAQNRINLALATLANWSDNTAGAPLAGSDLNHIPGELKTFSLITFQASDRILSDGQNLTSLFNLDTTGYLASDGTSPASGFQIFVAYDDPTGMFSIVLHVVPEPSTYGLIAGGLALAAAAVRRRRRQASGQDR